MFGQRTSIDRRVAGARRGAMGRLRRDVLTALGPVRSDRSAVRSLFALLLAGTVQALFWCGTPAGLTRRVQAAWLACVLGG